MIEPLSKLFSLNRKVRKEYAKYTKVKPLRFLNASLRAKKDVICVNSLRSR